MNVLFINPAWDAAGCSFRQHAAINKYTNWKSRHFRATKTFYDTLDIGPQNYNAEEFREIMCAADVIEWCSADHNYPSPMKATLLEKTIKELTAAMPAGFGPEHPQWNVPSLRNKYNMITRKSSFGFPLWEVAKNKVNIFHDYNSFHGHWRDRAREKDIWNRGKELKYSAVFSSIPQAKFIYDNCIYVPDLVDEALPEFTPDADRDFSKIILGHFPTGDNNNKNTAELLEAVKGMDGIEYVTDTHQPNAKILKIKRGINLAFDALWRGFHGATTVENLALGIPTMCGTDPEFIEITDQYFGKRVPILALNNKDEIAPAIKYMADDLDHLKDCAGRARKFSENEWSAKRIAENMVKIYEQL